MTERQLRRVIFACAAGLLLTLLAADACPDALDALVVGSAVADLATSEWALQHPGVRELNPLLQGPAQRAVGKTLGTAAILYGTRHLEKRGHRGWSRAIRIGAIFLWGGCAVNAAVQVRRAR